jgi:hypothetical protein
MINEGVFSYFPCHHALLPCLASAEGYLKVLYHPLHWSSLFSHSCHSGPVLHLPVSHSGPVLHLPYLIQDLCCTYPSLIQGQCCTYLYLIQGPCCTYLSLIQDPCCTYLSLIQDPCFTYLSPSCKREKRLDNSGGGEETTNLLIESGASCHSKPKSLALPVTLCCVLDCFTLKHGASLHSH